MSWCLSLPRWLSLRPYVFFYCFLPLSLPLSLSLLSLAWLGGTHYGLPPLGHAPGLINHLPLVNLVFLAIT